MNRLYYATFEKGYEDIIPKIIKKLDKNAFIKKLYADAVFFSADERFKLENTCFKEAFVVIDYLLKEGAGALNAEMKHLLEKEHLKIAIPREVNAFKLTFIKENVKLNIDANLKRAVEVLLKKVTKKPISFLNGSVELMFLAKQDGLNLFMRRLELKEHEGGTISYDLAYILNFLSEPVAGEVVLDPFAACGTICYARNLAYPKANVIANEQNSEFVAGLKKKAKTLKEKTFSVMNYNFLDDKFPIKFIDKIVTVMPSKTTEEIFNLDIFYNNFFEKVYNLKVKILSLYIPAKMSFDKFVSGKYEIVYRINNFKYNIIKLKLK